MMIRKPHLLTTRCSTASNEGMNAVIPLGHGKIPLRKLSSIEARMAYSHAILGGNTQVTNLLTVRGCVTREAVADSMRALVAHYEILRCTVAEEAGDLWFVAGSAEPDGCVTEEVLAYPDTLMRVFEDELSQCVDPATALWRIHIAYQPEVDATHLLLTQHHAINDAYTTQVLFRALLAALDGQRRENAGTETLTCGVDARTSPNATSFPRLASSQPLPFFAPASLPRRRTGIWIADLSDDAATRLTRLAREGGISTNAVLTGLFASAFCDVVGCDSIDIFTAVSLRNRLTRETIQDLGCFIDVLPVPVMARAGPLSLATTYYENLRQQIVTCPPVRQPHGSIRAAIEAARMAQAFSGLGVTNSGVMDGILGASSHEILDFRPAVNRVGGNLGLTLHVTKLHGRTSLTFTYPRPLMPDIIVAQTAEFMKQRLSTL